MKFAGVKRKEIMVLVLKMLEYWYALEGLLGDRQKIFEVNEEWRLERVRTVNTGKESRHLELCPQE